MRRHLTCLGWITNIPVTSNFSASGHSGYGPGERKMMEDARPVNIKPADKSLILGKGITLSILHTLVDKCTLRVIIVSPLSLGFTSGEPSLCFKKQTKTQSKPLLE